MRREKRSIVVVLHRFNSCSLCQYMLILNGPFALFNRIDYRLFDRWKFDFVVIGQYCRSINKPFKLNLMWPTGETSLNKNRPVEAEYLKIKYETGLRLKKVRMGLSSNHWDNFAWKCHLVSAVAWVFRMPAIFFERCNFFVCKWNSVKATVRSYRIEQTGKKTQKS